MRVPLRCAVLTSLSCAACAPAGPQSLAVLVTSETYPGLTLTVSDDLVAEMVRFGAGELHCVAAVMGGIGAQEAIKLLTRQFATPAGTTIYNAMASTTSVFDI